jgi:hypothetical protein
MLVTTVKQQILIGKAARVCGGYDNLAKVSARVRYYQENNIEYDIKEIIEEIKNKPD